LAAPSCARHKDFHAFIKLPCVSHKGLRSWISPAVLIMISLVALFTERYAVLQFQAQHIIALVSVKMVNMLGSHVADNTLIIIPLEHLQTPNSIVACASLVVGIAPTRICVWVFNFHDLVFPHPPPDCNHRVKIVTQVIQMVKISYSTILSLILRDKKFYKR
jgi:hypothetical protein